MKIEDIQGEVKKVVCFVFENMYFMFPEAIGEDDPAPSLPESCFKATVGVKNSSGMFVFYGSEQLVMEMAKNLLETDRASNESDLIDIFREAANVIAGNLVTTLDLDASVAIDVPVVERLEICSEPETTPGVVFNIDDEFFKMDVKNSII